MRRGQGFEVVQRKFHTLEEAARFLGEPAERTRERVEDKEIPHVLVDGEAMIPALPLRDFYYDYLLKSKNATRALSTTAAPDVSAAPNASKEKNRAPAEKKASKKGEWISSFLAAKVAGMAAPDVHRLGREGKVRTRKEGKVTLFYRPDVEALKEPTAPPDVVASSPTKTGSGEPSRVTSGASRAERLNNERGDGNAAAEHGRRPEKGREFHGATIEEAVSAASEALGLKKEEVVFEVVDSGSSDILGAGKRHARIMLTAGKQPGGEEQEEESALESASRPAEPRQDAPHDRTPGATASPNNTLYYTPEQAAQRLGVSAQEFEALVSSGRLRAVSVDGSRRLLPVASVNRLAEAHSDGPRPASGGQRASTGGDEQTPVENVEVEAYYYTPLQAAELLGVDVLEVNRLFRRGELPAMSVEKHQWYPAQPLEDLVRRKFGPGRLVHAPQPQLVRGSAKRPSERSTSGAVPRRSVSDPPKPKGVSSAKNRDHYYTVEEASQKLGKPPRELWLMVYSGKLRADKVGDRRLFLKRGVDQMAHSSSSRSVTGIDKEVTGRPDPEENLLPASSQGGGYYSAEEVAEKLGKDVDDVWHMVYVGQLRIKKVGQKRVFVKQLVDNLLSEEKKKSSPKGKGLAEPVSGEQEPSGSEYEHLGEALQPGEGYYYTPAQAVKILGRNLYNSSRSTLPTVIVDDHIWIPAKAVDGLARRKYGERKHRDFPKPRKIRVEHDESAEENSGATQDELRALREANERLTGELEQEREVHARHARDTQHELDQLEAELENLRQNSSDSVLGSRLRRERELRQEAERWARDLDAQLNAEMVLNSERERRFADLESKLDRSETRREELEKALSSEKGKMRRLEENKRLLDEVRRLLGAVDTGEPSSPYAVDAPESTVGEVPEEAPSELALKTPFGEVAFLPPFPLTKQDEELLRLIARENELTAEQIRKYTKRRRASGELEDLLDRLADEGVKDLVKEVSEDRYRFNPAALQNG